MAAGNWDLALPISAQSGFVEWPKGPLTPAPGEVVTRVEVWLMQQSTGAVQMTYQTTFPTPPPPAVPYNFWVWRADEIWYPRQKVNGVWVWKGQGLFTPGPALGTAIAIGNDANGLQKYFWWTQEVQLVAQSARRNR